MPLPEMRKLPAMGGGIEAPEMPLPPQEGIQWQPGARQALEPFRFDPLRPGSTPENPLNEQHPEARAARAIILIFNAPPQVAQRFLEQRGFEAVHLGGTDFALRLPGERVWKRLDPLGPDLQDVTDLGGDVVRGLGMVGGMAATPAMPIAGGAGGAALTEAALQALSREFGLDPTMKEALTAVGVEGALGAAGPLLSKGVGAVSRRLVPHTADELLRMPERELLSAADEALGRSVSGEIAKEGVQKRLAYQKASRIGDINRRIPWKGKVTETPMAEGLSEMDQIARLGKAAQVRGAQSGKFLERGELGLEDYFVNQARRASGQMGRYPTGAEARVLSQAKGEISPLIRSAPGEVRLPTVARETLFEGITQERRRQIAAEILGRQPLSGVSRFFGGLAESGLPESAAGVARAGKSATMRQGMKGGAYSGNLGGPGALFGMWDVGLRTVGKAGRWLARSADPWHRILRAEGKTSRLGRYVSELVNRFTRGDDTGAKAMVYTILQRPEWRERIFTLLGGDVSQEED